MMMLFPFIGCGDHWEFASSIYFFKKRDFYLRLFSAPVTSADTYSLFLPLIPRRPFGPPLILSFSLFKHTPKWHSYRSGEPFPFFPRP